MTQRFEGRNLDDALTSAAAALGVAREQIKYGVLTEKRGFLGGTRRIVIEAEVRPAPAQKPATPSPAVTEAVGEPFSERSRHREDETRRKQEARPERRDARTRELLRADIPPQESRSSDAESLAGWCTELAALAEFELAVRTTESDDTITVRLYGRDAQLFADRNGELLDAVQLLLSKSFQSMEKRIDVDALDFKARRSAELAAEARRLAELVRHDGVEQTLAPMNPGERRAVHLALADHPEVTTESRGEGHLKRITILRRPAERSSES